MDNISKIHKKNKLTLYLKSYHELSEKDFYPPEDKRIYKSGIDDIIGGDNFTDYTKYFYNQYEDEIFDT